MFKRHGVAKEAEATEFTYVSTLSADKAEKYFKSVDSVTKEANQIYRANHGGGMPCPDNICTRSFSVLDIFDIF